MSIKILQGFVIAHIPIILSQVLNNGIESLDFLETHISIHNNPDIIDVPRVGVPGGIPLVPFESDQFVSKDLGAEAAIVEDHRLSSPDTGPPLHEFSPIELLDETHGALCETDQRQLQGPLGVLPIIIRVVVPVIPLTKTCPLTCQRLR